MNPNGDFFSLLSLLFLRFGGVAKMRRMIRPTSWVTIHATRRMSTMRSGFRERADDPRCWLSVTRNTVEHNHERSPRPARFDRADLGLHRRSRQQRER